MPESQFQIKTEESGPLLITHWGLSGPAVLKISAWEAISLAKLKYNFEIEEFHFHCNGGSRRNIPGLQTEQS
jgi:hypothetical protein